MQDIKPGANSIHKAPQKSKTLNRQYTKKPTKSLDGHISVNQTAKKEQMRSAHSIDIKRNSTVSHFGKQPLLKNPKTVITPTEKKTPETPANKHSDLDSKKSVKSQPQKSRKELEIDKAVASVTVNKKSKKQRKLSPKARKRLIVSVSSVLASLAVIATVLYFSIPGLSIHFASNQAGINASYPREYPEGFVLAGTAKYENGSIVIPFRSDDKTANFAVTQTKTIWDATKLKNEVRKVSQDNFTTTEYKGLTIYNYTLNNQYITTWINGEILYVISGDANLDPSQIRVIIDGLS